MEVIVSDVTMLASWESLKKNILGELQLFFANLFIHHMTAICREC